MVKNIVILLLLVALVIALWEFGVVRNKYRITASNLWNCEHGNDYRQSF